MRIRSSLSERVYLILNTIMVLIYASGGIYLLLGQISGIHPTNRKIFGGIMLLYAGYRGFSLYQKNKIKEDEK